MKEFNLILMFCLYSVITLKGADENKVNYEVNLEQAIDIDEASGQAILTKNLHQELKYKEILSNQNSHKFE